LALQRNILISFAMNVGIYFFQFLTTIVVSRILTPTEVGLFAVSMAVVTILQGLREFGAISYLIQQKAVTEDHVRSVFAILIVIGFGLGLLLFASRHWFANFYGNEELANIIAVLSLSLFVFPFGLPATAMLRRERRFGQLATVAITASVGYFLLTCALALSGFGAMSLAIGTFCSSIIQVAVALYFWPQHMRLKPSFSQWRAVTRFGATATLGSLVLRIGQAIPELMIGRFSSLQNAALFTRGRVLPLLVDRFCTSPFSMAGIPELANNMRQNQDIQTRLMRVAKVTALMNWSVLSIVFANAEGIIFLLYGEQWTAVAPLLRALCLNQAVVMLASTPRMLLEASGSVGIIMRNEVLILIVLVATLIFGSYYNLQTLCWALSMPSAIAVVLSWLSIRRKLEFSIIPLMSTFGFPLVCAAVILASQLAMSLLPALQLYQSHFVTIFVVLSVKCLISGGLGIVMLRIGEPELFFTFGRLILRRPSKVL
jgi:O-antigen/teichoic acid export membrane protein